MVTKKELDMYLEAYSKGTPLISDEEYDVLLEDYLKANGESKRPFLRQQQSSSINDVVGTLGKVYGVTEPMRPGQKTYVEWYSKNALSSNDKICLQPKFDGCSVAFDCKTNRWFTRGNYDDGVSVDVTELFENHFIDIPNAEQYDSIKFEAIMSKECFDKSGIREKFNYKRPRDAVSAIITSRRTQYSELISLIPLRAYKDGKQMIPDVMHYNIINADNMESIQSFINDLLSNSAVTYVASIDMHYECDGVVASVVNNEMFVQNKEVAIKILNNIEETKLVRVEYRLGTSGRITPVAIVEPVKFGNVTVTNITLSTIDRVDKLKLHHNDTVRVIYNIVPYLLSSYGDGDVLISIPSNCPKCGSKLDLSSLSLIRCTNPQCDGLRIGSIIRYCKRMSMYGVSDGVITKLYDLGIIKSISDLYRIRPENISHIDGFGIKSADNVISSIYLASKEVPIEKWLGAFPAVDIGTRIWKLVIDALGCDISTYVKFFGNETPDEMIKFLRDHHFNTIRGIGNITSMKIETGLINNWADIHFIYDKVEFKSMQFKGIITLSGTRDKSITSLFHSHGYDVNDSLTKKTTALVIPDESYQSSKVSKAKSLGIPIYTVKNAYKIIKGSAM